VCVYLKKITNNNLTLVWNHTQESSINHNVKIFQLGQEDDSSK